MTLVLFVALTLTIIVVTIGLFLSGKRAIALTLGMLASIMIFLLVKFTSGL